MNSKLKNGFYIFLPIILGGLIGWVISGYIDYEYLAKPPASPPKILFPIMWSVIYLLMGIAYYIYRKKTDEINIVYYVQLIVNLLWSIIFFIFKLRFVSVLWIALLDILVILTMKEFKNKDSKVSIYFFIPYLLWSLYATYLTVGIFILN